MPPSTYTKFISSFPSRCNIIEPGNEKTRLNLKRQIFFQDLVQVYEHTFYLIVLWAMEYF